MTAPTTYATLITEVENHAHRADINADVPMLIQLGEARLNRRLRSRDMLKNTTITTSTSDKFVSLPTGFLEIKSFNNDYGDPMIEVSMEELEDIRYGLTSAYPRYYAITSRLEFERTDSTARSYPMVYYKRLDIVNGNTEALAVLGNHPDLYVYSALLGLEPFLKNDKRVTLWANFVDTTIKELNYQETRNRRTLRSGMTGRERFNILRVY